MRGTSLATRFLLTLVATAALPLASYGWLSLRGMREQIDEQVVRVFLPQLAADHAEKIEAHFEKVDQACAVVREIARAALRSPAETAEFEEQVELVPDLLDNFLDLLLLADGEGRVVYWRDGLRLDPSAHGLRAARVPNSVANEPWFRRAQDERGVQFAAWGRSPWLAAGLRALDPAGYHLGVALDVPQPQGKPAVLFALLRWAEVQRIVDEARGVLVERAQLPSAEVFLVGADGVTVAHTDRARYGQVVSAPGLADALHEARTTGRGSFVADGGAWRLGSAAFGRRERAFTLGIAVPEAELFAPSDAFARVWLLAIAASVVVLVAWSLWASRTIVRPVRALVAATRRVGRGDLAVKVAARGGPELGELATAFNQMADELAEGRRKLAGAEREQAWAEMARQVAHEVKNPLQPMRLAAELLQRARREGDARAESIADRLARTVLEQTAQLDRIAGEFRAFAGVADAARAAVELDDWLGELCERQRDLLAGKSIQIEALPGAAGVRVSIDRGSMARVLGNLIQNALDAAPQGVCVTLATTAAGGEARLAVADDGPGISAEVRERIFEPYFTTKSSGTGLGLAICRRIVEAHGGRIELVESRPGRTAFCLVLPTV